MKKTLLLLGLITMLGVSCTAPIAQSAQSTNDTSLQAQLKDTQAQLAAAQEKAIQATIQADILQRNPKLTKIEAIVKPQDIRIIVASDNTTRYIYRWTDGMIEEIGRIPLTGSRP